MRRLAAVAAGLASGAVLAVCGAFVQADRFRAGSVVVPYGVVLAVGSAFTWQLWLGRWMRQRLATLSVAVGWITVTLGIGTGKVGNGVVLAADTRVTWYLGLGAVAVSMGASLPLLAVRPAPAHAVSD